MIAEGVSGPLCWTVSLGNHNCNSVRMTESAPAPASPTEEELAAANVWMPPSESDDEW